MTLETDRLILRRFSADDLTDLYEYLSDEETVKYEPYKPMNMEETKDNLKWRIETDEMIAVELKETHKMIGNIYLGKRDFNSLELGFEREAHLKQNVYFWTDQQGNPLWKDTFIYAKLNF